MMERFLERVSLSQFRENFILKGGMLVAAMVGLDTRSTMDIDATVRGAAVDVDHISDMISEIISVPVKDGVFFSLKSVSEIMDEAEYPGVRVSMETMFDGVRTPFKIDISTGDAITPREVLYRFHLMFEERPSRYWPIAWRPCWPRSWKRSFPAPQPTPVCGTFMISTFYVSSMAAP